MLTQMEKFLKTFEPKLLQSSLMPVQLVSPHGATG